MDSLDRKCDMTPRERRRLEQNLRNEARWLQKTIFSLRKAQDARTKIVDTSGTPLEPLVSVDDTRIPISEIETLIDERVRQIRTELGVGAYQSI